MRVTTKIFGEIDIADDKLIVFPGGIIGFPNLTHFALIHDEEKGNQAGIRWMQSMQEPSFALPVMDPLYVREEYNPQVEEELLKSLGEFDDQDLLVLVTVTVPSNLNEMTVNLKGPMIINAANRKACQIIVEGGDYPVKFPVYDILQTRKAGE